MSQFILINRIQVQNANAIAGFTWGFPAITHFLGFSHNLARKLSETEAFNHLVLGGCAVVSHKQKVHAYIHDGDYQFTQYKTSAYLNKDVQKVIKGKAPSIIEEGKMNMTVSLLIGCNGYIGNRQDALINWLTNACLLQRLAGGTVLKIASVEIFDDQSSDTLYLIKRKLLPGFLLLDRSSYLEKHFQFLQQHNPDIEMLDAWMDFITIKQKARPKSDLITKHLVEIAKTKSEDKQNLTLLESWNNHCLKPYQEHDIPDDLISYFAQYLPTNATDKLLNQWKHYYAPTENTEADWEYVAKPNTGFLIPIMVGYKAISEVYDNDQVENTRDNETPVCFVESVDSIGEWKSVHRLKTMEELQQSLWHYIYENHWYLCKQYSMSQKSSEITDTPHHVNPEDDFS